MSIKEKFGPVLEHSVFFMTFIFIFYHPVHKYFTEVGKNLNIMIKEAELKYIY